MSTLKDNIAKMIHNLPEDSTLKDIQYSLNMLEKIGKGQESIKNGKESKRAKSFKMTITFNDKDSTPNTNLSLFIRRSRI